MCVCIHPLRLSDPLQSECSPFPWLIVTSSSPRMTLHWISGYGNWVDDINLCFILMECNVHKLRKCKQYVLLLKYNVFSQYIPKHNVKIHLEKKKNIYIFLKNQNITVPHA